MVLHLDMTLSCHKSLKSKPLWVSWPMASELCGSRLRPLSFLWSRQSSVCGRRLSASSSAFRSLLPSEPLSPPCGARSPSLPLCREMSMRAPKCRTEGLRREDPLVNFWLNSKNFHNLFSNLFLWVASSAFPTLSAAVRKPSQYVPARVCSSSVHCRVGCHHLPVSPISCSYQPENKQWNTIIEINIILTCCDSNLRARLTSQKLSLETSIMESS